MEKCDANLKRGETASIKCALAQRRLTQEGPISSQFRSVHNQMTTATLRNPALLAQNVEIGAVLWRSVSPSSNIANDDV